MPESATGPAPTPVSEAAPVFDERYLEWKHWQGAGFGDFTVSQAAVYAAELRRAGVPLPPGAAVLDIGFGNGPFLGFGRARGWRMHGAEANPALVAAARQHGFEACLASGLGAYPDASFALVTAFDVLEHVPQAQMADFLNEVRRLLQPGGCFVARFPNGDSPFGLINQHGDITHVTVLGSGKVRYFAAQARFELVYLGGEALPLRGATPRQVLHRLVARPVKAVLERAINLLFFPQMPVAFCASNAVTVWRKPAA